MGMANAEERKLGELVNEAILKSLEKFGHVFSKHVTRELFDNDVVPVVRCKDCKHLMFSDCYGECRLGHLGIVKPWDFCSYGERKDGDR